MSNPSSGLRFDVYERVHLADDVAAIDELEEIELVPRIQIVQQGEQVMLKGHLLLTGEYRGQDEERSEQRLEHWIPVEITLPMNRINRLDDISVQIDNFDVDLLTARTINVTGVLSLLGIEVEQPAEQEEWQREEPFTVVHKREPEEEQQSAAGWNFGQPQQDVREANAGWVSGFEGWAAPETQGFRESLQREAAQREAAERAARQQEAAESEARAQEAARRDAEDREAAARAAADREAVAWDTVRRQQEAAEREAAARAESAARAEQEREAERVAAELEAGARLNAQREVAMISSAQQQGEEEEEREAWREALARLEAEREEAEREAAEREDAESEAVPYELTSSGTFAREEVTPPDGIAVLADDSSAGLQGRPADEPEPAESYSWQPVHPLGTAAFSDVSEDVSAAEPGRQEMKVALGSKPSEDPSESSAASVNFRSLLQSSRREQEAKAAAEQSAQKEAQAQADKAAEDEIEWKNLFFGRSSEEQSFKRVRLCIVQREETLDSIAGRYQLQAREIALYNRLSDQSVSEGQVLYIP